MIDRYRRGHITVLNWGGLESHACECCKVVKKESDRWLDIDSGFGVPNIVQDEAGIENFVADIRKLGAQFAVDNFGLHHSAFEYLQRLKPLYVKLSPAYIRNLHDNLENQFFISSVVNITRSLDIRVFALGVEDAGVLPLLQELGVEGYQGYVNGALTEWV